MRIATHRQVKRIIVSSDPNSNPAGKSEEVPLGSPPPPGQSAPAPQAPATSPEQQIAGAPPVPGTAPTQPASPETSMPINPAPPVPGVGSAPVPQRPANPAPLAPAPASPQGQVIQSPASPNTPGSVPMTPAAPAVPTPSVPTPAVPTPGTAYPSSHLGTGANPPAVGGYPNQGAYPPSPTPGTIPGAGSFGPPPPATPPTNVPQVPVPPVPGPQSPYSTVTPGGQLPVGSVVSQGPAQNEASRKAWIPADRQGQVGSADAASDDQQAPLPSAKSTQSARISAKSQRMRKKKASYTMLIGFLAVAIFVCLFFFLLVLMSM